MRHVALRSTGTTHYLSEGSKHTLCNYAILADESFEGNPVYRVTETTKEVTCVRCTVVLRESLFAALKNLPNSWLEQFFAVLPDRSQRIVATRNGRVAQ
jgi:hypothetical protein